MQSWRESSAPYVAKAQEFIRHNWKRILAVREKIRFSEEAFHLVLAGAVGVIGGFTNLIFYHGIRLSQKLIFGHAADPVSVAESIPSWQRFVIPALGGLAAGGVLFWGLRLVGKQGSASFLEVVVAGDGRLPFRSGVVRAISSLLSISSGASIGREGAITQLTAMFASKWGQVAKWHPYRLRLIR